MSPIDDRSKSLGVEGQFSTHCRALVAEKPPETNSQSSVNTKWPFPAVTYLTHLPRHIWWGHPQPPSCCGFSFRGPQLHICEALDFSGIFCQSKNWLGERYVPEALCLVYGSLGTGGPPPHPALRLGSPRPVDGGQGPTGEERGLQRGKQDVDRRSSLGCMALCQNTQLGAGCATRSREAETCAQIWAVDSKTCTAVTGRGHQGVGLARGAALPAHLPTWERPSACHPSPSKV